MCCILLHSVCHSMHIHPRACRWLSQQQWDYSRRQLGSCYTNTCLHPCLEEEVRTRHCIKIAIPLGRYILSQQLLPAKPRDRFAVDKHPASQATAGRWALHPVLCWCSCQRYPMAHTRTGTYDTSSGQAVLAHPCITWLFATSDAISLYTMQRLLQYAATT